MKTINEIRYIFAIVIPVIILLNFGGVAFLLSIILCLYINNVVDDIVFYYGSKFVDCSILGSGIPSPVEGVVTLVEKCVPLYNHLLKKDILTKEELVSKGMSVKDGEYHHVAIFLNKLNKHLVASIGECKSIKEFSFQGENIEMVNDGMLIADNTGCYLKNTFVDIEYFNGVHVVVTMDKYISKAVRPTDTDMVEMLICRGSQCDVYAPSEMFPLVRCHEAVNVLQPLFHDYFNKNYDADKIMLSIDECITKSGFTVKEALLSNLKKTSKTINYNYMLLFISLIMALFSHLAVSIGMYLYLFLLDRSLKNYLYATMNNIGYKYWMTIIYNSFHNLIKYGK